MLPSAVRHSGSQGQPAPEGSLSKTTLGWFPRRAREVPGILRSIVSPGAGITYPSVSVTVRSPIISNGLLIYSVYLWSLPTGYNFNVGLCPGHCWWVSSISTVFILAVLYLHSVSTFPSCKCVTNHSQALFYIISLTLRSVLGHSLVKLMWIVLSVCYVQSLENKLHCVKSTECLL